MVAQYPNSVADDSDLFVAVNNLATTLVGALLISGDNTGGLGIAVVSTFNFPTTGGFITVDNEAISYTGISGNRFTGIIRAADGTIAAPHDDGADTGHDWVAAHHNAPKDEIEALESDGIDIRRNALQNNILVNSGFDNWQRGTSFTNPANGSFPSDAWKILYAGVTPPSFVIAEEPTAINVQSGQFALRMTCTNAGATLSQGLTIQQNVEDVYNFRSKAITLSVYIKTTLVNKARIKMTDDSGSTISAFHTGSGVYEKLVITRTIDATATFLHVDIGFLNPVDVSVGVMYIDSCMMVVGTTAFDWQPQNPFMELARCQRYYENQPNFFYRFYDSQGSAAYSFPVHFAVPKASVPTVTITNGTFFHVGSTAPAGVSTRGFDLIINTTAGLNDSYIGGLNDATWAAATT
jgi:hypothetical protein